MTRLPGQEKFILDDYPLYNLNRTSATYIDEMAQALKQMGMNQTQWRVLGILGDENPSTVTAISRRSVIKMSTLTRMLDRMVEDKLITRKLWKKDKRIVQVHITTMGRKHLDQALRIGEAIYERAFHGISHEQTQEFMKILIKMRENLNQSPYYLKSNT